jgi:uncharacterized membrane protein YbhN (UPF0104 family)
MKIDRRALATALRVLSALAVVAACAWFLRRLDLTRVGHAIAGASLPLVLAAATVNLVHLGFRALRLRVLLAPERPVGVARLFRYNLVAIAASNLFPARAGEVLRVWLLKAHEKIPATTSVAVFLVEKAFDLLALLALAAPLPWLLPSLPPSVAHSILLLGGLAVVAAAVLLVASRLGSKRPGGRLDRFARGAAVVRRPGTFALALATSLAAWLTDTFEVLLILWAVHANVPAAAAPLILLTLNMALAVPSTPAQLGAFELGAAVALELLGVDPERALAFAVLYHGMQVLPTTLLGIAGMGLSGLRVPRESATSTPAARSNPERSPPPPATPAKR